MSLLRSTTAMGIAALLLSTGIAPATAETTPQPPNPPLSWTPCPAPSAGSPIAFDCATLAVPLDYAKPRGAKINLALTRTRASDPASRLGSLVFHFGGPGSSGVDELAKAVPGFESLRQRYDLVSFDQRGVSRSAPVRCLDDRATDEFHAADSTPLDQAGIDAMVVRKREYGAACARNSGAVLARVGTANAARDLEQLRIALGEHRLNYFGFGYGTWLGANYAHQFPRRVGRFVLDAAVDPSRGDTYELELESAAAAEQVFKRFAAACAAKGSDCPLGTDQATVMTAVDTLLASLPTAPAPGARRLTRALGLISVIGSVYTPELWDTLAAFVADGLRGNHGPLLEMADVFLGRDQNGHYQNFADANLAIHCADNAKRHSPGSIQRDLPRFRAASPRFGDWFAWSELTCSQWPVPGDDSGRQVSAPNAAPIMVVGTVHNPSAPYDWSVSLAKNLGSGFLVTYNGEGYGAYYTGNPCIRTTVHDYLFAGTVPAPGTTCS